MSDINLENVPELRKRTVKIGIEDLCEIFNSSIAVILSNIHMIDPSETKKVFKFLIHELRELQDHFLSDHPTPWTDEEYLKHLLKYKEEYEKD